MYGIYFLAAVVVIQIIRAIFLTIGRKDIDFLWLSTFIISIPLAVDRVIAINNFHGLLQTGTMGPEYRITIPLVLAFILIIKSKPAAISFFKLKNWVTITFILIAISIFNPANADIVATIAFGIFFFSIIFLFKVFWGFLDVTKMIKGFFDGLSITCLINFLLSICFPVLKMKAVTGMFHKLGAANATREGTRDGAIGLFQHPGTLALFTVIASSFFVATFLYNYRKKLSFFLLFFNTLTIFLTFSRTSYVAFVVIFALLIFVKNNARKNLLSVANIFKFVVPITLVICYIVFFSPISDTFVRSDADTQYNNRIMHYKIAYKIFRSSPVVGVGLNSHLAYLNVNPGIVSSVVDSEVKSQVDFFRENPIHNIHLIVLAETGILGFVLWIVFIFGNISASLNQVKNNQNKIFSLSFIGVIVAVCFYGMTGWSPFSMEIMPLFLLFSFFAPRFNEIKLQTVPV